MGELHIVFFPLMAHGHMIPTLEMAKLFLSRGLKTTIITTEEFSDPVKRARQSGHDIGLSITSFPPEGSSLPDNITRMDQLSTPDLVPKFFEALGLLKDPVEELLHELHPNCLVTDMFLPWTVDSAAKFGIPRLVFHGTSYYSLCATEQMRLQKPYEKVSSDSDPVVLRNLPHEVSFARTQVPEYALKDQNSVFAEFREQMMESVGRSYGVVVNSFFELESAYADHYRNVLGRKAWHIGPLLLCDNGDVEGKARRGKESAIDEHECLAWLDLKRANSVVYVCFGSIASFTPAQLHETAVGLEASSQDFIWVVRKGKNEEENEEWMPEGFEERTKGRGLIIRGWAPQLMILDHPATGAFVTHCGWNSTLEGICAGVPMVTWPVFAEQFYNEKLVTEILKIGVSVGNKIWKRVGSEGVLSEAVTKAVKSILLGEAALEIRSRARHYKEMARKAVEEGGSSYTSLSALIEELSTYRPPQEQNTN